MMKKIWKRTLALLLTVLMLGGAAPLGALSTTIPAAAEDREESILEFLQNYFFPYLYFEDWEYTHEFSPSSPSPDSRFLAYMLVENAWPAFYPFSDYGESSRKYVTYPGYSFKCYRVPASPVDFVLKNVFNFSDATITAMREDGAALFEQEIRQSNGSPGQYNTDAFSYTNGYYYFFRDNLGVGGPTEYDWRIINVIDKGGYTYVRYTLEEYEDDGYGKQYGDITLYYCKLQKKTVTVKPFWTLWSHSATKPADFPACYADWEEAYQDYVIRQSYSSSLFNDSDSFSWFRNYYYDAITHEKIFTQSAESIIGGSASLYDFDRDGVPEMIIDNAWSDSASYHANVFSFINGDIEYIGPIGFLGVTGFRAGGSPDYPGCFYTNGRMGYYLTIYYYKDESTIISEEVAGVREYWSESDETVNYEVTSLTDDRGLYECWERNRDSEYGNYGGKEIPFVSINSAIEMGWEEFLRSVLAPNSWESLDEIDNLDTNGSTIQFGSYPQTRVTNPFTILQLNALQHDWVSYDYYAGTLSNLRPWETQYWTGNMAPSDFMRYCDVTYKGDRYRGVTFDTYRPVLTDCETTADLYSFFQLPQQYQNGYECGKVYWFKYEPLKWKMIDSANGIAVCLNIIDAQPFNDYAVIAGEKYYADKSHKHHPSEYIHSSLRNWLNRDFSRTAFSPLQRAELSTGEFESDKVFLLSYSEATQTIGGFNPTFEDDDARVAQGSDYAKCQGLNVSKTGDTQDNVRWWLRNSAFDSGDTEAARRQERSCIVDLRGSIDKSGLETFNTSVGIRPVIRFKTADSNFFVIGKDTNSFGHNEDLFSDNYRFNNSAYYDYLRSINWSSWLGGIEYLKQLYATSGNWQGSCHGIATTLCLGHQGKLDLDRLTDGAECYSDLKFNDDLKDLINFYHILQATKYRYASKEVSAEGWDLFNSLENAKVDFLQSLVAEAQKSERQRKPFLFSLKCSACMNPDTQNESGSYGHSIVVCGYQWNSEKSCHEIKLFDENSFYTSNDFSDPFDYPGQYATMSVSSDYKTFDFRDSNHKSVTGLQNCWKLMSYWSIEKMYEEIPVFQAGTAKTRAAAASVAAPSSEDTGLFCVEISYGKKFKLANAESQWLSFDGRNYDHTMPIRKCNLISGLTESSDADSWSLQLDKSRSFVFSDMDDGCMLIFMLNGKTYSVTASHSDTITVTEDAITISGSNQSLDLWLPNADMEFTRVVASAPGDVHISLRETGSEIQSDLPLQNVQAYTTDTYDLTPADLGSDPTEINVPYDRDDTPGSDKITVSISAPFKATYKKPFTASVSVQNLPDGARIEWSSRSMRLEPSADGTLCTVTPTSTGVNSDLTATVYSADNEKLAESSTNIDVRYAWWQYLILILLFGFIWY